MASFEQIADQADGWDDLSEWTDLQVPAGALQMDGRSLTESILQGRRVVIEPESEATE